MTITDEDAATQICQDTHTLDGRQVYTLVFAFNGRHCVLPSSLLELTSGMLVQIDAKRSLPQSQKPKLRKLFVGGLAPETTEGAFPWQLSEALPS